MESFSFVLMTLGAEVIHRLYISLITILESQSEAEKILKIFTHQFQCVWSCVTHKVFSQANLSNGQHFFKISLLAFQNSSILAFTMLKNAQKCSAMLNNVNKIQGKL